MKWQLLSERCLKRRLEAAARCTRFIFSGSGAIHTPPLSSPLLPYSIRSSFSWLNGSPAGCQLTCLPGGIQFSFLLVFVVITIAASFLLPAYSVINCKQQLRSGSFRRRGGEWEVEGAHSLTNFTRSDNDKLKNVLPARTNKFLCIFQAFAADLYGKATATTATITTTFATKRKNGHLAIKLSKINLNLLLCCALVLAYCECIGLYCFLCDAKAILTAFWIGQSHESHN